jgi:hypothetical protein
LPHNGYSRFGTPGRVRRFKNREIAPNGERPSISSFTLEKANKRLGVAERVVHWIMIVLRSTETLPLLGASKVANQPGVEVGDSSPGMPERVLAEIETAIDYSYNL